MRQLPKERDARLIYAAGFRRPATVSLVGVTPAIHLVEAGFSTTQIALLIGAGLAGSSGATLIVSLRYDSWLRRRVLVGLTLFITTGYLALAVFSNAAALVPLALLGMRNGMGRDRGTAPALDQAILPAPYDVMAVVKPTERTFASGVTNATRNVGGPSGPHSPAS